MKIRALTELSERLARFPGVGSRMAERLALHVAKLPQGEVDKLIESLQRVKQTLRYCKQCYNFADQELCHICLDDSRNCHQLCVVEQVSDLRSIEKTESYKGLYHVLQGCFSPLDGVGPKDLRIGELMNRIKQGAFEEVILATSPNANGEATAAYLIKAIKSLQSAPKLSRIGIGVALGSDLSLVDKGTMGRSLAARISL